MGAVPKHRLSKSRGRERREHLGLRRPTLVNCSNCKKLKEPHTVCPFCNFYNGVERK